MTQSELLTILLVIRCFCHYVLQVVFVKYLLVHRSLFTQPRYKYNIYTTQGLTSQVAAGAVKPNPSC